MNRMPLLALALVALLAPAAAAADPPHPLKQWVKRHPTPGAKSSSPRLGYECAYAYDPGSKLLVRYGGHNQGGGGEQNSEVWTYDLASDAWRLRGVNDAPPGVCCGMQNCFHDALGRYVRFPSFSGSHGWQSWREIALKDSSVWTFDVSNDTWRPMRPLPDVRVGPLRGAAYVPEYEVVLLHAGEGTDHGTVAYDLYANQWHSLKPQGPKPAANLSQPGFAYDAVNGVFVLFGSQFSDDARTWLYDLKTNAWRVLQTNVTPPADKTSPVLAADTRNGIVLCSVLTGNEAKDLETWVLDVAKATWTKLDHPADAPSDSGARNRQLLYLADQNLFVLENRTKDEQQIWTYRYADAPAPPPPLPRPSVAVDEKGATLTWTLPQGVTAVDVYRASGAKPWSQGFTKLAEGVAGTTYRDVALPRDGSDYVYRIAASGEPRRVSPLAHVAPPVPAMPVVSAVDAKRVELEWPSVGGGATYEVQRAAVSVDSMEDWARTGKTYRPKAEQVGVARVNRIGGFELVTEWPLKEARLADTLVDLSKAPATPREPFLVDRPIREKADRAEGRPYPLGVYAYRVRAVGPAGVRGGWSPYALSIPSAVQGVYAQEVGDTATRLKWAPHPLKGLKGYHVYRYEGRYGKEPITRVTDQPITATELLDKNAGKDSRRYEVVAVDALGQEGEPSMPVWSRREWARFYVPFIGEWHQ